MKTQKITMLGLGAMGSRMAINLLKAGYAVTVWNREKKPAEALAAKGGIVAATPKLAVKDADIVISMVADSDASRFIWLDAETGAIGGIKKDAIAIESSTLTVGYIEELATEMNSREVAFLDAPVVGSRPQVEMGNLIYLVGGQAEILQQAENILLFAGSGKIHHVGDIGQGMAMKLAVNALFGIQVAALAEILGMLAKNGLDLEKAMQCLGELPVINPAAKNAANLMLQGNHAPMFPINLVEKDFRYILETAENVDAPTPVSTAIRQIYEDAIALGFGGDNITGVARLFI
jgi:3-hydroxyisobutyrate dehydrogenase